MIQFIYFDLGNVLLLFDHGIACRQIGQLCELPEDDVRKLIFESDWQHRYETGEVESAEFFDDFSRQTGRQSDYSEFCYAASSIFELNIEIIPVVTQLRLAGFRLGILSNTCDIHWQYVARGRYRIIPSLFDEIILSYESKSSKPDRQIYDDAIQHAGCQPGEIFFMDDREENVTGAREAGMDAVQFVSTQQLIRDLRSRDINLSW